MDRYTLNKMYAPAGNFRKQFKKLLGVDLTVYQIHLILQSIGIKPITTEYFGKSNMSLYNINQVLYLLNNNADKIIKTFKNICKLSENKNNITVMRRNFGLNENRIKLIVQESISSIINGKRRFINESVEDQIFDMLSSGVQLGAREIRQLLKLIIGKGPKSGGPFKYVHQVAKFLSMKRNHTGGKTFVLQALESIPRYDFLYKKFFHAYFGARDIPNERFVDTQSLEQFKWYIDDIRDAIEGIMSGVARINWGNVRAAAIQGGNNGKDVGILNLLNNTYGSLNDLRMLIENIEKQLKTYDAMAVKEPHRR